MPGFAEAKLTERIQEALVKEHLATVLTGYIDPNGTAVEAREKPVKTPLAATEFMAGKIKREVREAKRKRIRRQLTQTLKEMLGELPTACDRGTKCNVQRYQNSWNGYKLHLDTADCACRCVRF